MATPRIVAVFVAILLTAGACSGQVAPGDVSKPDRTSTTTSVVVDTTQFAAPTPIGGGPTSNAPSAPTSSGAIEVSVWLTRGEQVEAVHRSVPRVARVGAEAVKALLIGPTATESRAGFGTAVPAGTRFLDLTIDKGIAKVDLSRDFESGGGTLSLTLRLAQMACTVSQFPTVTGVRFALAGKLLRVFSGDGILLDKPVNCASYREVVAPETFPGVWPFASRAELEGYELSADRLYRDPVVTAREFASRYIGMDNPLTFGSRSTGSGRAEVEVGPRYGEGRTPLAAPRATFVVSVRQLGHQDPSGAWDVVGAASPDIVTTIPAAGVRVRSPVGVAGSAHTFEGNVLVQVREDGMLAGQSLGKGAVTGGGDELRPFRGDVEFRAPAKAAGALVYEEISAADGQGILRATVVRVRF